jgi:hypothetical protein
MKTDHAFRIHDFLTLRIRDTIGMRERLLIDPWRGYRHYCVPELPRDGVDLDVEIGPLTLAPPPDARLVNRKFWVAPDYFACRDTYKVLSWKVEIHGWDSGRVRLRLEPGDLGTVALGSRLIDCTVRYLLALKGAPVVHCCGVVSDGRASLLSGRSGVGKSTLAMQLVGRGAALLGDNWVGVHQGQAWSFHTPINVHDYNVAGSIYARLPVGRRCDLWAKAFLRRVSLGYLKKSTPIALRELFPEIVAEQAPLSQVLTFSQGPRFAISPLARPVAIQRLVANDMMDREAYYRYLQAYATVFPDGLAATHWRRLGENLDRAFPAGAGFHDVVVERRITPAVVNEIQRFLAREGAAA